MRASNKSQPLILDCTIRDGSYSVDFKFTENDTAVLSKELEAVGIEYIEIGHGLGIGAMDAGKGKMPATDLALLRAAKRATEQSKIGMFFIADLAKKDRIVEARGEGLDFIRVGCHPNDVERAFPYLEASRKVGLFTCLNLMKTNLITPKEFSEKVKLAKEAGAEVVYAVDSTGSMLPSEVSAYFSSAREVSGVRLGFHGHNNLMLVMANCLAAIESGAQFIDTTLCGLGRSAGNAPTEILVAVLKKMGVDLGMDPFSLFSLVENQMWPLVSKFRSHDMLSVVSGMLEFHSGYIPKIEKEARRQSADLHRLLASLAPHCKTAVDPDQLYEEAKKLSGTARGTSQGELVSFWSPKLSVDRVGNSCHSIEDLMVGLVASARKKVGAKVVIQLIPSEDPSDDILLPEFVSENERIVLGRVRFGSYQNLKTVLELCIEETEYFAISSVQGWAADAANIVRSFVGKEKLLLTRYSSIENKFFDDLSNWLHGEFSEDSIVAYDVPEVLLQQLEHYPGKCFLLAESDVANNISIPKIHASEDWNHLGIRFDVAVCGTPPEGDGIETLNRYLSDNALIVFINANRSSFAGIKHRYVSFGSEGTLLAAFEHQIQMKQSLKGISCNI